MKKILALVFILVLSVSSICSAFEQPDPDRWFWIGSDDKIGFWLDSQTMEFEKELSDRITRVWILKCIPLRQPFHQHGHLRWKK